MNDNQQAAYDALAQENIRLKRELSEAKARIAELESDIENQGYEMREALDRAYCDCCSE